MVYDKMLLEKQRLEKEIRYMERKLKTLPAKIRKGQIWSEIDVFFGENFILFGKAHIMV